MAGGFPLGAGLILGGLAEEMLPGGDERVRRLDAIHPVHGLRMASKIGALKTLLKAVPSAAQMTAAGVAGSLTPRILLQHALGAEAVELGSPFPSYPSYAPPEKRRVSLRLILSS